jgi:hypothetical protein
MCVDHMQLFASPCSDHCPDIDARFAHDPTAPMPTLSHDPYLVIQGQFRNAPWRRAGEVEPKDPNTGRSVLYELLEERTSENKGPVYKCRLCNREFNRSDRAITHLRHKHLDHRPIRCGGECGTKGWCEDFLTCHSWAYLMSLQPTTLPFAREFGSSCQPQVGRVFSLVSSPYSESRCHS